MAKEIDADSELFNVQPKADLTFCDDYVVVGRRQFRKLSVMARANTSQRKKKLSVTVQTETDID